MNAIQSITQPVSFFALQADKLKTYSVVGQLYLHLSGRAKVRFGAQKHHGFDSPERSAIAARPSPDSGFSISYPVLRGAHGSFYGGPCGGIRKSAPVLRPVCQPHTVCHPHLTVRWQFLNCHVGATMADNRIPTPSTGITSTLARQQAIENALSMALFHIRHGDTQQGIRAATAKAIRAASLLKQACTEIQISGRA